MIAGVVASTGTMLCRRFVPGSGTRTHTMPHLCHVDRGDPLQVLSLTLLVFDDRLPRSPAQPSPAQPSPLEHGLPAEI